MIVALVCRRRNAYASANDDPCCGGRRPQSGAGGKPRAAHDEPDIEVVGEARNGCEAVCDIPAVEDLRRAIDVLGAHTKQGLHTLGHSVDRVQRLLERNNASQATERLQSMRGNITALVGER